VPLPVLIVAALLLALSVWLYLDNRSLRRSSHTSGPARPTVQRLWSDVFDNGQPTHIVVGDASLAVFLDTTRRTMSATEYRRDQMKERPHSTGNDPSGVEFARQLMRRPLTTAIDAELAYRIGALAGEHGAKADVLQAREATPDTFRSDNVVLTGPLRGNPWAELFEERLAFPSGYDPATNVPFFSNKTPASGEPAEFRADSDQGGFCRVAYLAHREGAARAVLITGVDLASTEAGVDLLTDERAMADLAKRLGVAAGERFPFFEVMLKVRLVLGEPLAFEIVAHRTYPAAAPAR
jgi:hypothetical protein